MLLISERAKLDSAESFINGALSVLLVIRSKDTEFQTEFLTGWLQDVGVEVVRIRRNDGDLSTLTKLLELPSQLSDATAARAKVVATTLIAHLDKEA